MPPKKRPGVGSRRERIIHVPVLFPVAPGYPVREVVGSKVIYTTKSGAEVHPISNRIYLLHEVMKGKFSLREEYPSGCKYLYVDNKVYAMVGPKHFVLVINDYKEWPE